MVMTSSGEQLLSPITNGENITLSDTLSVDTISEYSAANGVSVDSVLLKDGYLRLKEVSAPTNSATFSAIYHDSGDDTLKYKQNDNTARTIVNTDQTQTLSGKTLSSPAFSGTIASNLTHSGTYSQTNTTEATSSSAAAFVCLGGMGIAKHLYVGLGAYLLSSGGTASELNWYGELNTTIAVTGPYSTNLTVRFTRIGRMVLFQWSDITNTSTAAEKLTGTISQTQFRPSANMNFTGLAGQDNGSTTNIYLIVPTNGNISFGVGNGQAAFTGSGTASIWGGGVVWSV